MTTKRAPPRLLQRCELSQAQGVALHGSLELALPAGGVLGREDVTEELGAGWVLGLGLACAGWWLGYFPLSGDILWNTRDETAPS